MALTAPQAQKKLDKHQIDGRAIGAFMVSNRNFEKQPFQKYQLVLAGLGFVFSMLTPEGPFGPLMFLGLLGATALWPLIGNNSDADETRLVIVTNLGVAVGKTRLGTKHVSSWEVRPEAEVRYELDTMEVRQGESTVELTVGDATFFAFGEERDTAFRLYARQPTRWSGLTDRPAPG